MTRRPTMPLHVRVTHGVAAGAVGVVGLLAARGTAMDGHPVLVFVIAVAATRLVLGAAWIATTRNKGEAR